MTDQPRPTGLRRPTAPAGRISLWPRPGLRDLTAAVTGTSGPATEIRAREWGLVLTAGGIPHVIRRQGAGFRLLVPRRRAEEALSEIAAYADERANIVLPDPEAEPHRPSAWLTVLAWMGVVTGFWGMLLGETAIFGRKIPWRSLGAGDSSAMLAGHWERAVTSLCLHADPAHLFGNAACGALFLSLLCRETGVGLGFALTLAAGVSGNVLKALIQGPGMHFLGASTAVFGALGVLGGVRLANGWPPLSARRSAPAGAALMLLAMLGAGSEDGGAVDLAGHLFGFVSGAILGLAVGILMERRGRPGVLAQVGFGLLTVLLVCNAWGVALSR
jgi:membrane associated rhomboid family serine protease